MDCVLYICTLCDFLSHGYDSSTCHFSSPAKNVLSLSGSGFFCPRPDQTKKHGLQAVILIGAPISGYNDLEYDAFGYFLCFFATLQRLHTSLLSRNTRLQNLADTANSCSTALLFRYPFLFSPCSLASISTFAFFEEAEVRFIAFHGFFTLCWLVNISAVWNTRSNSPTHLSA